MLGIFIDIEATGLDPYRHRCLEVAIELYDLTSMEKIATYEQIVHQSKKVWSQSDPESLLVNGFTWEQCCKGKEESLVANEIRTFLSQNGINRKKSVFIAQNSSFDRAFLGQLIPPYEQEKLNWPYHWLDLASMYWGKNSQKYLNKKSLIVPLSKNAIAKEFSIPPEESPHRAINGVDHLVTCYRHVMEKL